MRYLIVGLGNYGDRFKNTYHNVGFMVLDRLAYELGLKLKRSRTQSLIASADICADNGLVSKVGKPKKVAGGLTSGGFRVGEVLFAYPQTFMNLSGRAVEALLRKEKIPLQNLLVIYDDIDLDVGKIRIRKSGSGGTHNGMRSIISELGTTDFSRVRVGIGRPPGIPLDRFVLSQIKPNDMALLGAAYDTCVQIIKGFVKGETIESLGNKFNGK
ncbi:MAG: aminoacyl-tRNA hydrolase [Firmicutes bacterium]|nr:aminoacyl-tRNA hydrolase [Bacillota bacterium]